jgi:hypothetical protein
VCCFLFLTEHANQKVEEATEASSAFDPAASISPFAPTKFGQQHIPGGNGNSQRRGLLK